MNRPPALDALFSTSTETDDLGSVATAPVLRFIRPAVLAVWVIVFGVEAQTLVSTSRGANWMVAVLATVLFAAVHIQFWYEDSEQGRRFHRAVERMRGRIYEDNETGLPNSRHFVFELRRQMMRSVRNGRGFALLLTDFGGFDATKEYQDKIIPAVTRSFRGSLADGDFIAHLRGPIFAGIIMDDRQRSAAEKADNLLQTLGACIPLQAAGEVFPVVSLSGYQGELEVRDFLRRAQRDLLSARSQGVTMPPETRRRGSHAAA